MATNPGNIYDSDNDYLPYRNDGIRRKTLWNRVGCIIISCGRSEKDAAKYASTLKDGKTPEYATETKVFKFTDFDFKFRISTWLNNDPKGTADVSILGLSTETMNQIITLTSYSDSMIIGKRIKVFAGYAKEDNPNYFGEKIIDCDIKYAEVSTTPPEMWLHIIGCVGERLKGQLVDMRLPDKNSITEKFQVAKTIKLKQLLHVALVHGFTPPKEALDNINPSGTETTEKYKFKDFCTDIVKLLNRVSEKYPKETRVTIKLDMRVDEEIANKDIGEPFVFNGNLYEIIPKINERFPNVYCYLIPDREIDNEESIEFFTVVSAATKKEADEKILNRTIVKYKYLSKDTGLIGMPSVVEAVSLKCRCLLDPSLQQNDIIHIRSQYMPTINTGKYTNRWVVNTVTHSGHLRGNEWYTDITAYCTERASILEKRKKELTVKTNNGNIKNG